MKKRMLTRLATIFAALVLLTAVCVFVSYATTQVSDPATTGINAQIDFATTTTCPACNATGVTWQALPTTKSTLTVGGHYYVPVGGVETTKPYYAAAKGKYCIHLNGQSLSSSGQVLDVTSNSEVHIFGSGTVTGNTAKTANQLGSVAKITTAKLYLHGGTYTTGGAGNVIYLKASTSYVTYGQLHLYDGATITGGNVTSADLGGNVHVEVGVFTMHGGTVSGGQAKSGGNVHLTQNGTLTMTGGTISGGVATADGGNVFVRKSFTMSAGTITGGQAASGGNVNIYGGGNVKFQGGTVTGGKAKNGGNFYVGSQYGYLTMTGGTVSDGVATTNGGNINANNGYLTISAGTVSGGQAVNGGNIFTSAGIVEAKNYLTVTDDGDAATPAPVITGGTATGKGGNIYLRGIMNLEAGTVTLGKAVDGGNIAMYSAAAVTDADGNVTTAAESNKATLNVSGGTVSHGTASSEGGNLYASSHSRNYLPVTVTGGTFSGGTADTGGSVHIVYAEMNMSDGLITGGTADRAGNVHVSTGAKFTMTGGSVTKGYTSGGGGNFYVTSTISYLTIKNGTVSDGKAASGGGNIHVNNGYVTISGGTIANGSARNGGNLYNYAGYYQEKNNVTVGDDPEDAYAAPVITGGTAGIYGGNIHNHGRLILGKASITGGQAPDGADLHMHTLHYLTVREDYESDLMVSFNVLELPEPLYGGKLEKCTALGDFSGTLALEDDENHPLLVRREGETCLFVSSAALVGKDGSYTWYSNNADMMADYDPDKVSYVQANTGEIHLEGQSLLVDLVGQIVSFTGNGSVTCFDSANDDYRYCGNATFGENVTLKNELLTAVCNKHYYTLKEEGAYSFHRLELALTSISLRPSAGGLYYTGQWHCDEEIAGRIGTFGVAVSLVDMPNAGFVTDSDTLWTESDRSEFVSGTKKTGVLINRILKDASHGADEDRIAQNAEYAKKPIYAVAYATVDGQCLVSPGMNYSLHDVLTAIDADMVYHATSAATMREFIAYWNGNGLTGSDWDFTFEVSEDIVKLNTLYSGRNAYHGEMHDHASTGGTSDGKMTLEQWAAGMEKLEMDFATIVDHRQALHMQLPQWSNDIFVGGTEAAGKVTVAGSQRSYHYNMIFSDVNDLETVLKAFPEFNYKQDAATGEWHYANPVLSKERMRELIACIHENNGQFVFVHPKQDTYDPYLGQEDQELYWFADYTGLEVSTGYHGDMGATDNVEAYDLWVELLGLGKKLYATAGSDWHLNPNTSALTTMYSTAKNADAHVDNMRKGNFSAGSVGIRMAVGDTIMGGETSFGGQRLMVSVGDFHNSAVFADHTYKIEIYQDNQVVHTAAVTPCDTFYYAMDADKDASFYRVVVWDEARGVRIAVGNPIWNVK